MTSTYSLVGKSYHTFCTLFFSLQSSYFYWLWQYNRQGVNHSCGARWRRNRNSRFARRVWFRKAGISRILRELTAPFNNMRTLTFKAQPTNAFFATVNQVFGASSQLPTTVERAVIKSLSTVQITKQCSAVVGS